MSWTIFRPSKSMEEKSERHRLIHFVWKKKLFVPLMNFMSKYIKKFMIKSIDDIPATAYNRNFRILKYSLEKGTEDWYYNFYGGIKNGKKDKKKYKELEENYKTRFNCHWWKIPQFFVNMLITICLEDTAYRELINCVMMRLQGEMNRIWNPEIKHRFPLYISMHDGFMPFFIEWMRVEGPRKVMLDVSPQGPPVPNTNKKVKIPMNKEMVEKLNALPSDQKAIFLRDMNRFMFRLLPPIPESKANDVTPTSVHKTA